MKREAVLAWLTGQSPDLEARTPTLALDTNAIFGRSGGLDLLDAINRANEARGDAPEIRLVLSSVVWCEKLRQMGERFGARFDPSLPLDIAHEKKVVIEPFDGEHAKVVAQRLAERFPSRQAWADAKRARYLRALGLAADTPTRDGTHCSGTIDWLVVGHAEAMGYLLVSDDGGPEFDGVTRRCTYAVASEAARALLRLRGLE